MISSIVLVAALLINTLSFCSAENVYCVTPTAASCSSCPHNTHCATLSEYAQEAEMYFTSNTTMVFLPGDHVLDRNITVTNVARLTIRGESSLGNIATIVRNGSVGFSFTNMVNFNIYSLAFTSSWSYGSLLASNFALLLQSTQNAELVNCSFHNNIGTALAVKNTSVTLVENEFLHNQCTCGSFSNSEMQGLGCGITAFNSTLVFTGNSSFSENILTTSSSSYCSGAIWAAASSLHFNGTNKFTSNSAIGEAAVGGAIYANTYTSLNFTGTNNFKNNSADVGGAIYANTYTSLNFTGTNNFKNNSADVGSAIYANTYTSLSFTGTNHFTDNSADVGGAIYAYKDVVVSFYETNNFINNSAIEGGAIYAAVNTSLCFTGTSSFRNNSALQGGAISANFNSKLTFSGSVNFTTNGNISFGGGCGGAMYLSIYSYFSILPYTNMHWENNHANFGGAICVFIANPLIYCTQLASDIQTENCFFQLPGQNLSNVQLVFKNNFAVVAGSVLYGGAIDNCRLNDLDSSNISSEIFVQYEDDKTTSSISSDPFRVCLCENNHPNCSKATKTLSLYPGETVQISVVTVGQRDGIVPARAISRTSRSTTFLSSQYIQRTHKTCTTLHYTVYSQLTVSQLELYADGFCSTFGNNLVLLLDINRNCPHGFVITTDSCVCHPALQSYTFDCNIINGSGQITRRFDEKFWVGTTNQSHELILYPHCPFDYCVVSTRVFSLNNTDIQCDYNRSGLLCGACKTNYSLVLGTNKCRECKNGNLALLVLFAVMGVALVFLLFVCKLTVATGTLSGLVFYANVVGDNYDIFLRFYSRFESPDPLLIFFKALSAFIAWINLDFGIETCFYNGMDAYSKIWLQFVFPIYLWVLVGLMILISHYSQRFANLLGSNPVSVLATLILLSYVKVIRTCIIIVSFADLEYYTKVWLYDANIDYLVGKHIPLFLVALLVFLFLFLPYTLLLLFGQWLQAISHLRLFSWVNRLKPFIDSYHAPYKAKHRYWPGLLLIVRLILLGVTFNQQDHKINLLPILLGAVGLQMWALVSGGVYKNWYLNALEGSFVLNLIILCVVNYYIGPYNITGYMSVSIALVTFIGILVYHIFQQLRHTKLWKKIPKLNMKLRFKKLNKKLNKKLSTKQTEDIKLNDITNDLTESGKFDQLREPLLDDIPQPTHSVV